MQQDGEKFSRTYRIQDPPKMKKPLSLDKQIVFPVGGSTNLLKTADGLAVVLGVSTLQHILVGEVFATFPIDELTHPNYRMQQIGARWRDFHRQYASPGMAEQQDFLLTETRAQQFDEGNRKSCCSAIPGEADWKSTRLNSSHIP